jgi:hypothetical protein
VLAHVRSQSTTSASCEATARAIAVFPIPGGPCSVTNLARGNSARTFAISASRPTSIES